MLHSSLCISRHHTGIQSHTNIPTMDLSLVNTLGSYSFLENLANKLTVNCGLSYSASKQRTSSSRLFKGTGASVGFVN